MALKTLQAESRRACASSFDRRSLRAVQGQAAQDADRRQVHEKGGRNNSRAAPPCGSAAAATSRPIASSTSGAARQDIGAKVERLEYDPNRSAFIALIKYSGRRAVLHSRAAAPRASATRSSRARQVDVKPGNAMPIGSDPGRHDRP